MSPLVSQSAVIGIPSEEYGEEIVAYIVLKDLKLDQASAQKTLDEYCREHLSKYKIPRVYKFVEELPRNHMGKISKVILKKMI